MTLGELRSFVTQLPTTMDDFEVVNGEVGYLDPTDDDSAVYRCDKPIIALYVDKVTSEVCFFHQTREDVSNTIPNIDIDDII